MGQKQIHQAILDLLKGVFILLFAVLLIFIRFVGSENFADKFIMPAVSVLIRIDLLLYMFFLIRGRTGKKRVAPIILSSFVTAFIVIPYFFPASLWADDGSFLSVMFSSGGYIALIICLIILFKMGSEPKPKKEKVYNETAALLFMKNKVTSGMLLPDLLGVFEEMCRLSLENEHGRMILFEPGARNDEEYIIHLVRQTNGSGEKYNQITMDITYSCDDIVGKIESMKWTPVWSFELETDIFDYVRNSLPYELLKTSTPIKTDLFIDRT